MTFTEEKAVGASVARHLHLKPNSARDGALRESHGETALGTIVCAANEPCTNEPPAGRLDVGFHFEVYRWSMTRDEAVNYRKILTAAAIVALRAKQCNNVSFVLECRCDALFHSFQHAHHAHHWRRIDSLAAGSRYRD